MTIPYTCCKCDYQTNHRGSMINHFKRKKPCPNINNIELTDAIKQTILDCRMYHVTQPMIQERPTIINNNNNTINNVNVYNIITKMDPDRKIDLLMEQMNKDMPNLQDIPYFKRMRHHMLIHKDKPDAMLSSCRHIDDLFKEIIDFLQSFFDDETNIVYNCFIKSNLFHLYDGDMWDKRTIPNGMNVFIKTMKQMIFDAYELCLIRQMMHWKKRKEAKDYLRSYYAFISSFDNKPIILEGHNNDNKLLYNEDEIEYDNSNYSCYDIHDEMLTLWTHVEKDMKEYKKISNKQTLKQIVTHHSDKTIRCLDTSISSNLELMDTLSQTHPVHSSIAI